MIGGLRSPTDDYDQVYNGSIKVYNRLLTLWPTSCRTFHSDGLTWTVTVSNLNHFLFHSIPCIMVLFFFYRINSRRIIVSYFHRTSEDHRRGKVKNNMFYWQPLFCVTYFFSFVKTDDQQKNGAKTALVKCSSLIMQTITDI